MKKLVIGQLLNGFESQTAQFIRMFRTNPLESRHWLLYEFLEIMSFVLFFQGFVDIQSMMRRRRRRRRRRSSRRSTMVLVVARLRTCRRCRSEWRPSWRNKSAVVLGIIVMRGDSSNSNSVVDYGRVCWMNEESLIIYPCWCWYPHPPHHPARHYSSLGYAYWLSVRRIRSKLHCVRASKSKIAPSLALIQDPDTVRMYVCRSRISYCNTCRECRECRGWNSCRMSGMSGMSEINVGCRKLMSDVGNTCGDVGNTCGDVGNVGNVRNEKGECRQCRNCKMWMSGSCRE